jgi:hypothetical protein
MPYSHLLFRRFASLQFYSANKFVNAKNYGHGTQEKKYDAAEGRAIHTIANCNGKQEN